MLVENKTEKMFSGKIVTVLIQDNSPQGPLDSEHLKFLLVCSMMWYYISRNHFFAHIKFCDLFLNCKHRKN